MPGSSESGQTPVHPGLAALGLAPECKPPTGFDPQDVAPRQTGDEPLPLLSIAVDVSGRCNMACRYCAETASQPERRAMSAEVMEAAIRLLVKNPAAGVRPSIRIGSGEPLLALSLLRRLEATLEDSSVPIDVSITTNGTLLDDEVADWLAATGWRVKISLDGPQEVHDLWRQRRTGRPSYRHVARAVDRMMERCPERLSVAAVLCRGTDPNVVFESIAELGVRRIELIPVAFRPAPDEEDIRPMLDDVARYQTFVDKYADAVAADGPDEHPTLVRFEETVLFLMGYGNPVVPCGAGRSFAGVGPDGALYPCFRFAGLPEYRIGDIESGLDSTAKAAFVADAGRISKLRPHCEICWAAPLCGGPCFSVAEFFGPGDGAPDELHCAYKLADARAAFRLVSDLRDNNPERLVSFLPIELDLA